MKLRKICDKVIVETCSGGSCYVQGEKKFNFDTGKDTWYIKMYLDNAMKAEALVEFIKDEPHEVKLFVTSAKTGLKVLKQNGIEYELFDDRQELLSNKEAVLKTRNF